MRAGGSTALSMASMCCSARCWRTSSWRGRRVNRSRERYKVPNCCDTRPRKSSTGSWPLDSQARAATGARCSVPWGRQFRSHRQTPSSIVHRSCASCDATGCTLTGEQLRRSNQSVAWLKSPSVRPTRRRPQSGKSGASLQKLFLHTVLIGYTVMLRRRPDHVSRSSPELPTQAGPRTRLAAPHLGLALSRSS